jgi:hypothetical protein
LPKKSRLLRQRHGAAVPGGAAARARHLAVRVGERAAAGGARGRGGRDRQSRRNSLGSGDGLGFFLLGGITLNHSFVP